MSVAIAAAPGVGAAEAGDWPTYGHDPGGMRYSPLSQIDTTNVARLAVAWTYRMRPASAAPAASGDVERAPAGVAADRRISEGAIPGPGSGPGPRRRSRFGGSQATPLVVGG